jgi:hypothetical protein
VNELALEIERGRQLDEKKCAILFCHLAFCCSVRGDNIRLYVAKYSIVSYYIILAKDI